jgi:hypothetical protein
MVFAFCSWVDMRNMFLTAAHLSFLLACGGNISPEQPASTEPTATTITTGITPEWVATMPAPASIAAVGGRVFVTTRHSFILGEPSANGSLTLLREPGIPPLTLAIDKFGAAYGALTADTKDVVWASSDGRVSTIPNVGGEARTVTHEDGSIVALALDTSFVYYTVNSGSTSAVRRVPRAASESNTPAETLADNLTNARGIVVAGNSVFVALGSMTDGAILRVDTRTKQVETVARGLAEPCAIATAPTPLGVVWTERSAQSKAGLFGSCALATDENDAFLGQESGSGLLKASLSTRTANLWSNQGSAKLLGSLAADARHVYWISQSNIVRARK